MTEAKVGVVANSLILPVGPCFKITNNNETHFGFTYVDGLNVLVEEFNDNPAVKCGKGGFYFTTKEHIPRFYSFGIYLREVTIPTNDPDFKIIKCKDGTKWRSNKIIFGTKHSLFDLKTYKKFDLDIRFNLHILVFACQYGNVEFLETIKKKGDFQSSKETRDKMIMTASKYYQIPVLDWLKNEEIIRYDPVKKPNGEELTDDEDDAYDYSYKKAITAACLEGHLAVLEWWEKNNFKVSQCQSILCDALKKKHYHIVDWLINYTKIDYFDFAFIWSAIDTKDLAILQYWVERGFVKNNIDCDCYAHIWRAENYKDILEFLHKNSLIDPIVLADGLQNCDKLHVFELVKCLGIKIKMGVIMDNASICGHIDVLEWAKNSGFELDYTDNALYNASESNQMDVLNWWKASGLELKYKPNILGLVICHGFKKMVDWWLDLLEVDGKIDRKYLTMDEEREERYMDDLSGCG